MLLLLLLMFRKELLRTTLGCGTSCLMRESTSGMKRKENYREREKTSKANRKHCWCILLQWKELGEKSFLKSTTNASEKSDPHGESLVVKRRKWLAYLTTCIKQPLAACPNKQSIVTRWRRTTTTTPASLFLPNRTRICQACRHRLIVQAIRCAGLTVEANGEGTGKYWTGVENWSGSALARGRLGSTQIVGLCVCRPGNNHYRWCRPW